MNGTSKLQDTVLCLVLVMLSGNHTVPYILGNDLFLVAPPLLILFYASSKKVRLHENDPLILLLFAGITVTHFITFGSSVIPASLGFLLKVLAALLVVRTVDDFAERYVAVMTGLAIVSFCFFFPGLVGLDVQELLAPLHIPYRDDLTHIGIHNFGWEHHANRNAGMFWEPGAFAGYLVLAILLVLSSGRSDKLDKKSLLLLTLALLTTQSTTGYVTAFACFAAYLSSRKVLMALAGVVVVFWMAVQTLPFLQEKIDREWEAATERTGRHELNRFGNALYDYAFITDRPIFGWSRDPATRAIVDPDIAEITAGQGNGLTGFAVKFGLFGLACYIFMLYRAFYRRYRSALVAGTAVLVAAMLLIGEQFLDFPVFLALMFLPEAQRGLDNEPASISKDAGCKQDEHAEGLRE